MRRHSDDVAPTIIREICERIRLRQSLSSGYHIRIFMPCSACAWKLAVLRVIYFAIKHDSNIALQWRHNDHDSVSNHQPHGCLLKRLFRRRSKKTSKLYVTGFCAGNSPGPVNSPHKGPVTRKMLPFDDVIMDFHYSLFERVTCFTTWTTPVIGHQSIDKTYNGIYTISAIEES